MLLAQNIQVTLGRTQILRDVEFSADPGALTAIVGPNGSGKTTLLRALTQEVPYRGRVLLDGDDIAALKPWQLAARRGVLPQASRIAFPFNVREVVRLGLTAGQSGMRRDLPEQALERVGMAGYESRYYAELSGGEQQRVQLARVLCQVWEPTLEGRPRWLFLDEPVSSLDIAHQLDVMAIAQDFARGGGGVVAVMHDLNLTAMFADQVFMMNSGRLIAHGPARECMTSGNVSRVFECGLTVGQPPPGDVPFILPHSAQLS